MKGAIGIGSVVMTLLLTFMATPANAGLDPTYSVVLWDTLDFEGVGGEQFWGTEFFYQAINEGNPTYDWMFVGLKFNRQNLIGTMRGWDASMYIQDNVYKKGVVIVDAAPIHKTPVSGDYNVGVSGGGGTVSARLESNGYDDGYKSNLASWSTKFLWRHSFTYADQNWATKSGAYVAKVYDTGGSTTGILGGAFVYYQWSGWDWGCWCELYRNRNAQWPNGAWTTFQDLSGD